MFNVGDIVRIKSLEDYLSETNQTIDSQGAGWINETMKEYFGKDSTYEITYVNTNITEDTAIFLKNIDFVWMSDALELVTARDDREDMKYQIGDKVILKIGIESLSYSDLPFSGAVATITNKIYDRVEYDIEIFGYRFRIKANDIYKKYYEGYEPPVVDIRKCCDRCGCNYTIKSNHTMEIEDACLCNVCRKRRFITPYHRYAPHLKFFNTEKDKDNNKYLGIELEVGEGGEYDSNAAEAMDYMNQNLEENEFFIYTSHDSSINNGFEIITQPATFESHLMKKDEYKKMFEYLIKKGYRGHDTTNCGIHIHFSRDYYSNDEEGNIAKLLYLVEKFWDEIVIFSRRNYRTLERYAKKTDEDTDDYIDRWNKSDDHEGHYYSVNISNYNTIELRMFRSTLNLNTFFATLEFANNLISIAKEKSISELHNLTFDDLLTPLAKEYYESRKNKFEEIEITDNNIAEASNDNAFNNIVALNNIMHDLHIDDEDFMF